MKLYRSADGPVCWLCQPPLALTAIPALASALVAVLMHSPRGQAMLARYDREAVP
jgi:hypothetical protein